MLLALPATSLMAVGEGDSRAFQSGESFTLKYQPEVYDSLVCIWKQDCAVSSTEQFFRSYVDLPDSMPGGNGVSLPDSVYIRRLAAIMSPIQLPYNDVIKRYIMAYTSGKGVLLGRVLGLSQHYFPMFEEELARNNMPLELKMLPVIESALNPMATSYVGAAGLWQFMLQTGRHYGLEVTSFVDQRRDPIASTAAACKYLKELYRIYGDWTLVIASYNCGPGNVNKALKRAGDDAKTYWDIYPYLPKETRGYVPSFVAAMYAYKYHREHQIDPIVTAFPLSVDTLHVSRVIHLEQISSTLDTPVEMLRILNPQYKMDIIPATDKRYPLVLPQREITRFIEMSDQIYAKDSIYLKQYRSSSVNSQAKISLPANAPAIVYKVKSGDTLGAIARKYRVSVAQLQKWNNLRSANSLRVGQRLSIYK